MTGSKKPNVLFICADQWRADCIGALGHPHVKTPNVDALIAESVVFENHFGQCTPCGPSRTSLLTGMYLMNHRSGRNGTPLDSRHTNVALEARKLGYEPALFGYTDTSVDPRGKHPDDPALIAYDEGIMPGFVAPLHLPEEMGPWVADLIAKGYDFPTGRDEVFRPRRNFKKPDDRGFRYIPTEFTAEDSETAFLTDRFLQWLTVRRDRPWFAHFVFFRPHPPIIAPEPYNGMVNPNDVAMPVRSATPELEAKQHPFLDYSINRYRRPGRLRRAQPAVGRRCGRSRDQADDGHLLRPRRRSRHPHRAHRRGVEGKRRVRQHADRHHLGPCRNARPALRVVEGGLLRPGVPHPADHPRPASRGGCLARAARKAVQRVDRCLADHHRLARRHRTPLDGRPFTGPVPRERDAGPAGATTSSSSTISARSPPRRRRRRSALRRTSAHTP